MTSKTIPLLDQYYVDQNHYFKILILDGKILHNRNGSRKIDVIYRDIFVNVSENSVSILKILAKFLEIKEYNKLKKQELINSILPLLNLNN